MKQNEDHSILRAGIKKPTGREQCLHRIMLWYAMPGRRSDNGWSSFLSFVLEQERGKPVGERERSRKRT